MHAVSQEPIAPRIAVVDDDASLRRSLARLLRAAGMHAATYPSAEAYLDVGPHGGFDCLVLDIELNGMSGIELGQHLRDAGQGVPVVFLTAHDDPEHRARAKGTGCAAFLGKTEPAERVLAAVNEAVASGVRRGEG